MTNWKQAAVIGVVDSAKTVAGAGAGAGLALALAGMDTAGTSILIIAIIVALGMSGAQYYLENEKFSEEETPSEDDMLPEDTSLEE
jgi:hypothetical protein